MEQVIAYFLTPSHGLWLLIVVGWLLWRLAYMEVGRTLLRLGVVGLAIAHLTPLGYILILPLEDRFPPPEMPADVAGIILLGGAEAEWISNRRDQQLYNEAGERVMAAAMLAAKFPDAGILILGGIREDVTQAEISARALIAMGIQADRVTFETESRTTHENAANAVELVTGRKSAAWMLVTSAYHMPRSVASFRKYGIEITPWPTDYRAHREGIWSLTPGGLGLNAAQTLDRAVHEWLGLLAYRMRGWTDELFPGPQPAE